MSAGINKLIHSNLPPDSASSTLLSSLPLPLTLSVLLFLDLLGLPLPVHGSPTPCAPPEPAYVQRRGSGGNPGTHQTSLLINLSW